MKVTPGAIYSRGRKLQTTFGIHSYSEKSIFWESGIIEALDRCFSNIAVILYGMYNSKLIHLYCEGRYRFTCCVGTSFLQRIMLQWMFSSSKKKHHILFKGYQSVSVPVAKLRINGLSIRLINWSNQEYSLKYDIWSKIIFGQII